MKIHEYLKSFLTSSEVTLVGPMANQKLQLRSPVIYIDGGAEFKTCEGLVVGDGDSFFGEIDVPLNSEKDFSDLAFCLQQIPEKFHTIRLHGFLGGRRDHEYINVIEAHQFLTERTQTKCLFDEEVLLLSSGEFELAYHGFFSLLGLSHGHISLSGEVKYSLENRSLKALSSHGLSNQAYGNFSIQTQQPVIIFFDKDLKK